ncbi:unnamed protein product [Rodentolepis nana]|uniref:COesterase domain-containing protein n=1 Tax=Rodentolepis nana TaxID=102285 RepID=A0A158QJC5_RODNA|nr:unnamed protein product [Rodentolepis nana]
MNRIRAPPQIVAPPGPVADVIRLELEAREVPPGRRMLGRVYLSTVQPSVVERINLVVAKATIVTHPNENVHVSDRGTTSVTHLPVNVIRPASRSLVGRQALTAIRPAPTSITTLDPVIRQLYFQPGQFAIPYLLYMPETEMPSFAYAHPETGCAFVVNTALRLYLYLSGALYITQAIPLWLPALGSDDHFISSTHENKFQIVSPRKYYLRGDEVKVAVGFFTDSGKTPEARIVCRITCRAGNVVEMLEIVEYKKLEEVQPPASEVLREMGQRTGTRWKKMYETTDLVLEDYLSNSYNAPEFNLTYWLQVKLDNKEYEAPIALVDYMAEGNFKPPQISSEYQREYNCSNDDYIDAIDYQSACLQSSQDNTPTDINEDCFFLNIFVPQKDDNKSLFPVLIHIHGGSFQMGSSHSYPAHALASTGLVVVTFNYRLGLLGFFPPNTDNIPTNIGVMDQILVMEWVQRHIDRFYGNPKDVTIMGESAGAASVAIHIVSPKVKYKGLFSKAIIISGSDMAPWASLAYKDNKSDNLTAKLASVLGCTHNATSGNDAGVCLKNASSSDLMDAVEKIEKEYEREIWTPVIDEKEELLLRKPFPHLPSVKPSSIPLLIGVMESEASMHATYLLWNFKAISFGLFSVEWFRYSLLPSMELTTEMFERSVLKLLKTYGIPNPHDLLLKIIATYNCSGNVSSCHNQLFEVFSDFFCNAPTYRAALEQAKVNPNVYFFSMTHRSPKDLRPSVYGIVSTNSVKANYFDC